MHTTEQLDSFVTYREGLMMNSGNKNPNSVDEIPRFTKSFMSLRLCFVRVKNKYHFPPLNDSNSLGTADFDAYIITKTDPSNHRLLANWKLP